MKIISIILIAVSVFLNIRHGWAALHPNDDPEQLKMISALGINKSVVPVFGIFIIIVGLLLLFPQTFFIGNLLNAISFITIMALALRAGNVRMALIEIPFLIMPLALIWLKYPFNFNGR